MKLPPLRALECFEAVARCNSFSAAAVELNVTQSAVSHQVKQLEEYLGISLFSRHGRTFEMSDKGQQYFIEVNKALNQINNASHDAQHKTSGRVRLAVYSSQAIKWLIPRLDNFRRQYPEIDLVFNMVTDHPIIDDSVADCFITMKPPKQHFVKQFLYTEKQTLVCGQNIWHEIKNKPLLQALNSIPLLSVNYQQHSNDDNIDWLQWAEQAKISLPSTCKFQYFSHVLLATEAARYDLGIALIDEVIINDSEQQPYLYKLSAPQCLTGADFYFVYKQSKSRQRELAKIGHWLKMQCQF